MEELAINVHDLSKKFGKRVVVNHIDISVPKGKIYGFLGPNGSGKTTLMRTLLGLLSPMKGRIVPGEGFKLKDIGYLPQQTLVQRDFPASVWEIVLSGCQNHMGLRPFYNKKDKEKASECIRELDLTDLKNKCYRELSGGQQQRVLLARALCATGKMILLDEPVSGLDPKVTEEMYEIINDLNKNKGITVIMISHDIKAAVKYADHILHMDRTVFYGTVDEYTGSDLFRGLTGEGDCDD